MLSLHRMILVALLAVVTGCSQPVFEPKVPVTPGQPTTPTVIGPRGDVNLIFVGNSLTAVNDVPALVVELGRMDGRNISAETYAPGGFSLEDHWNNGNPQVALQRREFDFFIGQQGPSSLPESLELLKQYAKLYAEECESRNVKFALYMVWPEKVRSAYHDAVISNYTEAATATDAILCPAGLAWKEAWAENPNIPLYGGDQFHPSMTGSVLAALTIYGALFDKENFDFVVHDKMSWKSTVSPIHLEVLKRAALKSLQH